MELIMILLGIAFFGGLLADNNDDASIERRSTMDLIIKIPEEQYNDIVKHLTDNDGNYAYSDFNLREIIRNGTSLPKGHGDLIDRSKILSKGKCCCRIEFCSGSCEACSDNCVEVMDIESAPTVIPADKENDNA